jgi:type IV pilus assembly protein PilY1
MNLNAATKQDLVSGGTIANLAGDTVQTNRRFFYQPDVSLINDRGSRFLSVSIGSGNRADPLETTVNNRFYMIRQPVESQAGIGYGRFDGLSYKAIKDTPDLFDATSNVIMQGNATQRAMAQQALNDASGWFLELEAAGEKNLSSSITINSQIVFSTYLDLDRPGIPPRPVPFFGDENSMLAGNQTLPELDFGKMVQRVYWTEQF